MLVGLTATALIGIATVAALEGHAAWAWKGAAGGVLAVLLAGLTPVGIVLLAGPDNAVGFLGALGAVLGFVFALGLSGLLGILLASVACWLVRDAARSARHRAWVLADDPEVPYPL